MLPGDGRCYSLSTEGSTINVVSVVYTTKVGCEGLTCMHESRYLNGNLYWASAAGLNYYILVAGLPDEFGQYNFTVVVRRGKCRLSGSFVMCLSHLLLCFIALGRRLSADFDEWRMQQRDPYQLGSIYGQRFDFSISLFGW